MHIIYRKFDSRRSFGVELEVSNTVPLERIKEIVESVSPRQASIIGWRQTFNNKHWHLKTDATCGPKGVDDHGFEVVSYKASGYEDLVSIGNVADALQKEGVEVNCNCGLHVHVDLSDFTPAQAGVLMARWLRIEPFLTNAIPSRRLKNHFCSLLRESKPSIMHFAAELYSAEEFWDTFKPRDYLQRRVALNMYNYATGLRRKRWSRKTAELRLPEGSLASRDVKNWIRLFVSFVENSRNKLMPETLIPCTTKESLEYFGLGHEKNKFYIFSEGLMDTKSWLLERILFFGRTDLFVDEAKEILTKIWTPVKYFD